MNHPGTVAIEAPSLRWERGKMRDQRGRTYEVATSTKINVSIVILASVLATALYGAMQLGSWLHRVETLEEHHKQLGYQLKAIEQRLNGNGAPSGR